MKYPLVSLVMPTLNSGKFIRETIHSLIDQVYTRFEVIVVDGGSTDDTIPIVESYLGDGDLQIIKLSGEAGSMPKSLNAGLAAAKGEFIARMDADDIAYKWRLHDQVYYLVTHPEVSLVGTGADVFGEQEAIHRSPLRHQDIVDMFLCNNPFYHPTIMFRRELYDRGLYRYEDTQVCEEDYELWGRLIPQTICANMDQSSIRYRIHGQNAQYDPRKHESKHRALSAFCRGFEIDDPELVDALVEFQCSSFLRYENYIVLRDYARRVETKPLETKLGETARLPRLGWIHDAIVSETYYASFVAWFRRTKGWKV